jgi:hypothetical protein
VDVGERNRFVLAVGAADVHPHVSYNVATSDLEEIMELPCPGDPDDLDDWSHLDWLEKELPWLLVLLSHSCGRRRRRG